MKRKTKWSWLITFSLLVSLVSLPVPAQAQQGRKFRSDTGIVTLGMGQVLRITVNGGSGNDIIRVRFAWTKYMLSSCNSDGVCRHLVQSQGTTAPVNVGPNEGASYDVQGFGGGVRVGVFVAAGDVNADALIINTATGEVVSQIIMANTEGDFH
jgi:hypothetical protein